MLGAFLKEYSQRCKASKMLVAGSILEPNTPRVIRALVLGYVLFGFWNF
jgi:hypothetical protein